MRTKALAHFKNSDKVMHKAALVHKVVLNPPLSPEVYFERLCRAIAGQQLSVKAAATIWGRFEDLLGGRQLEPESVLKLKHEQMRGVGFSNAKARYIHGMAESVLNGEVRIDHLSELSNEDATAELVKFKGVGQWSAEMFLMFTLGRPDVFSLGDLGLRRAMEKMYNLKNPSDERLVKMAKKWSPYRTYACRVLWESLDNKPGA